jgi:hypothetical protein
MKAKSRAPLGREFLPVPSRLDQHPERAYDIRFDEGSGSVDRAVNVGFGRKVEDHVRIKLCARAGNGRSVADICADEAVARIAADQIQAR